LTHLTFGWEFNQPIDHLPPNITTLHLSFAFNRSVFFLPLSIVQIACKRFGPWFEQIGYLGCRKLSGENTITFLR